MHFQSYLRSNSDLSKLEGEIVEILAFNPTLGLILTHISEVEEDSTVLFNPTLGLILTILNGEVSRAWDIFNPTLGLILT